MFVPSYRYRHISNELIICKSIHVIQAAPEKHIGLPHEPRAGPRALLNPRGQLQSEGEWMAGPASQRRRAAMDKRSSCSAMHKSMDSPLTGRLPTSCPQTYTQRFLHDFLMENRRTGYPQPFRLLLLSIHSRSEGGLLTSISGCCLSSQRGN